MRPSLIPPSFTSPETNSTDFQWMFIRQNETDEFLKLKQKFPHQYFNRILEDKRIICYVTPCDDREMQRKLAFTNSMIWPTLHWSHIILGHPDTHHKHALLETRYHHPHLHNHIEHFLCNECQQAKPTGSGHGLLPDLKVSGIFCEQVTVDLIGPWPASTLNGDVEFYSLTFIETTTNLVNLAWIFEKSICHNETHFKDAWRSWYQRPMQSICNNGGEFIGFALLQNL